MPKDAPKNEPAGKGGKAGDERSGAWPLVFAVLLSAVPPTLLGLFKTIAAYASSLKKGGTLGPVAEKIGQMGDPGLVAVGMGAALIGVIGAALFKGSARVAIPVAMMLMCGWATAGVLFLLLPS
jgi:hypothetical protein